MSSIFSEAFTPNVSFSPPLFLFITECISPLWQNNYTEGSDINKENNSQVIDLNLFTPETITAWLWVVVPPIIFGLGTFGNFMNVVILLRIRSGTTTNVFFVALSLTDTWLLYSGLLTLWLKRSFGISLQDMHDVYCKCVYFSVYVSGVLSAWLLVAMSVQRTASIVWPHRMVVLFTQRKSLHLLLGIVGFVLILHSHLLYGTELKSVSDNSSICTTISDEYYKFITITWSWVDLIIFSLLPFMLLSISNSVLIWTLKTSVRELKTTADLSRNISTREKKTSSITITLLFLSLSFCLLSLPYCIYMLFTGLTDYREKRLTDYYYRSVLDLVLTLVSFMWFFNSAISFYLYCLTGTKFRTEFLRILCQCSRWIGQHWGDNYVTTTSIHITLSQNLHSNIND